MIALKIAAAAIIVATVAMIVRQYKGEYGLIIELSGIVFIMLISINAVETLLSEISFISEASGINNDFLRLLIKILGISVIIEIGANVCRDSGNSALASNVELVGKIIILTMSLPMIKTLCSFTQGLLK